MHLQWLRDLMTLIQRHAVLESSRFHHPNPDPNPNRDWEVSLAAIVSLVKMGGVGAGYASGIVRKVLNLES